MAEQWMEISIALAREDLARVTELLARLELGAVIEDEEDFRRFLAENRQYWDYVDEELEQRMTGACRVLCYLPEDEEGRRQLAALKAELEALCPVSLRISGLKAEDWENNWKQYYKPFPLGQRLYIRPEWETADCPADRVALTLNPGLIFGTGTHASTRMCLLGLEDLVQGGERVLDLGCGSGILAIAALLLGAGSALGCDIDPKAPPVAMENGAMNGLDETRLRVFAGDILSDQSLQKRFAEQPWDLILANIVADVILPLAPLAIQWLRPGGGFLCSGILQEREGELQVALTRAGYEVETVRRMDGWVSFACRRPL